MQHAVAIGAHHDEVFHAYHASVFRRLSQRHDVMRLGEARAKVTIDIQEIEPADLTWQRPAILRHVLPLQLPHESERSLSNLVGAESSLTFPGLCLYRGPVRPRARSQRFPAQELRRVT
jgi:hypothetical protein